MNEELNYQLISTNNDSQAITELLDALGLQGFQVAAPTSVNTLFECLMFRTQNEQTYFEQNGSYMKQYNYEVVKVENLQSSIQNMLNQMGLQGFRIANSWIEGNFIAFILYKEIVEQEEEEIL